MLITTYNNAAAFLQTAQALLEANEAANNLMLGLALRLARSPAPAENPPYFATVHDAEGIAIAALMTPPHNLLVYSDRSALGDSPAYLLRDLLGRSFLVPGALGPATVARAFAEAWPAVSGRAYRMGMHMRVYELRHVAHPRYSPGHLRPAGEADAELVMRWALAFTTECGLRDRPEEVAEGARRRVAAGDVFLWDDGRPVSMAARNRPTRHGISVGYVYTPPELRGRGYATSCVAALSQRLLDAGYEFCTLFTDLANPTSNDIYQQIGYWPICDYDEYVFL